MARRGWPAWAAIFLLLVTTLFLSACATRVASQLAPGPDAGGSAAPAAGPFRPATSQMLEAYGRLPLHFEENQGQADRSVRYLARAEGGLVALMPGGLHLGVDDGAVRLSFAGAAPHPRMSALEALPGRVNYYVGPDATRWRSDIPTYARVRYAAVYPGIDVVVYGNRRRVEYDFVVAPGADPGRIRVRIEGADAVAMEASGDLAIRRGDRTIVQHAPVIYQERDGRREPVAGRYVVRGRDIAFALGDYDRSRPLVIDPVIAYTARIGPALAKGIAVDAAGNAIIIGESSGDSGYPLVNPAFGPAHCCFQDIVVSKLTPGGDSLVYSTFIGSFSMNDATGVAVDSAGNAWVAGVAWSFGTGGASNYPTTPDAVMPSWFGDTMSAAGTLSKFSPSGSLLYSTYLAGTGNGSGGNPDGSCIWTWLNAVTVDAADNVYVVGQTQTDDYPTTPGAYQPSRPPRPDHDYCHGDGAAVVTKLTAAGALAYSTYLDTWHREENATAIAVDAAGNAYVGGVTGPEWQYTDPTALPFPVTATLTPSGSQDGGFVLKLNASGFPTQATVIGPTPAAIDLGADGTAYVAGTATADFATVDAFQPTAPGGGDGFAARINAAGAGYLWSTYVGGAGADAIKGIVVDADHNAWLVGTSSSADYPTQDPIMPKTAANEAVVTQLSPTGALVFSSPVAPGTGVGIAIDVATNVYLTGNGDVTPTPGAYHHEGAGNLFVMKLAAAAPGGGPQAVVWTNPVKVAVDGNTITKNAGCNGCADAGAVSQQTITSGNGFAEFKVSAGASLTAGLSAPDPGTSASAIEFGLRFFPVSPAYVEVRESGVWKATWTIATGDVHKVAVEGGAVKYYKNGTLKYTSATAPTYPLALDASVLTLGSAVQSAMISGAGGGSGPPGDDTPPTVAITSPANNATVSGTVTITAAANDNVSVTSVTFMDGSEIIGQVATAPYSVQWSTTGESTGTHTLTAIARDAAGNATTSAPITVTVKDVTPPSVWIWDPVNGASKTHTITIRASAQDNDGMAGVQFKVDGVDIGAEDTPPPYSITWDTATVPNGTHTLTAVARDLSGNTQTSEPVTITTSNDAPPSGGPVVWINPVKVAVSGNTITKNAGCNGCADAGAASQQTIASGNGSVAFKVSAGASVTAGLSTGNPGTSGSEIKFGLRFFGNYVEVRESGVWKASWPIAAGDVHKVAVDGGVVKYSQNGTVKYTSAVAPTYPLLVDTSLYTLGSAVQDAVLGP